jgi:hypothetical protein
MILLHVGALGFDGLDSEGEGALVESLTVAIAATTSHTAFLPSEPVIPLYERQPGQDMH